MYLSLYLTMWTKMDCMAHLSQPRTSASGHTEKWFISSDTVWHKGHDVDLGRPCEREDSHAGGTKDWGKRTRELSLHYDKCWLSFLSTLFTRSHSWYFVSFQLIVQGWRYEVPTAAMEAPNGTKYQERCGDVARCASRKRCHNQGAQELYVSQHLPSYLDGHSRIAQGAEDIDGVPE